MKKLLTMFMFLGLFVCSKVYADTSAFSSIPCPTTTSTVVGSIGPDTNGGTWNMYTYTANANPYFTPQYIYSRYKFANGTMSGCYETTPIQHGGGPVGWIIPNSWWGSMSVVNFSSWDGDSYATTDAGNSYTRVSCGATSVCAHGQGGVSCYHSWTTGAPQTCFSGEYCRSDGSYLGITRGTCITPCNTHTVSTNSCGCALVLSPVGGICPTIGSQALVLTTSNVCVMSNTNSACIP